MDKFIFEDVNSKKPHEAVRPIGWASPNVTKPRHRSEHGNVYKYPTIFVGFPWPERLHKIRSDDYEI